MLKKITYIGAYPDIPEDIRLRIILANKINLVLLTVCLLLLPIAYAIRDVFLILILSGCAFATYLLLTYIRLNSVSRFMTAVTGIFMNSFTHAIVLPPGTSPSASIIALSIAQIPLAFILFHAHERRATILALGVDFVLIVSYYFVGPWLYGGYDYDQIDEPTNHLIIIMMSFGIATGALYMQRLSTIRAFRSRETALAKLEENREAMQTAQQELEKSLAEVKQARQEEEQRSWITEGLSQVTQLLRQDDTKALCSQLIAFIVNYVEANQGGVFVVVDKEEKKIIKLYGCYAYGREKYQQKEIKIGEGLIGQTYLEKKYVHLTELPEGYTTITSGLGEATPRALIVVPMVTGDSVEGILEIAAFHPFTEHQISFLTSAGETIAAALSTLRVSEQTRALLTLSQQQTEDMRAQEEEMRQNLEELQATQEEMYRKEQEYLQKIEQLERQ